MRIASERASYYASDERLAASDTRRTGRRTFEEYRYDALGRRVRVKSQVTCEPTNAIECVTPFVRRTIWDGDQELAEVQVPVDSSNPPVEEMDTGYLLQSYHPAAWTYGDPNPFYGRVVYGPGLAIDQPLSVTRYDYRDSPSGASSLGWPRFSWQTYWNYQGVPAYGTVTSGAYAYPYQQSSGQTQCPILGSTGTDRCVIVQWPLMHSAYDQNRGKVRYQSWHGSLLESKRDRSGLDYRRNRLYDPQTGRFTQENPIGLAGGLNLYGFADGDPVNYSDPFGLCATDDDMGSGQDSTKTEKKSSSLACDYSQSSGALSCTDSQGLFSDNGYSGAPGFTNDGSKQHLRNRGPIPLGIYRISAPLPGNYQGKGFNVMRLTPINGTDTLGRDGFLFHGDSRSAPGTASEGCVIVGPQTRARMGRSGGGTLTVTP